MRSEYEILVLRELERGIKDPEKISAETKLPLELVNAVLKFYGDGSIRAENGARGIEIGRNALNLLIDVVILYITLNLLLYIVWWLQ
ncbi:hypothetical protein [Geoglobus acetivorans]|uniref:Uncharacterized protein n=1 Tax=Geoglobus acetivorans TaxID=565033 RepID=A0A0A7GGD9_GEOAI|nr:hypothetical protein GACE_1851 [Geoglobus acetivorans]